MILPSQKVWIFVASDPVDFCKGHDRLAALVQNQLRQKPFDGSVYVFRSKRADRLKLIYWDGSGLVMAYKRLEDYCFKWPAIKNGVMHLEPAQFEALFEPPLVYRRVKHSEGEPYDAEETHPCLSGRTARTRRPAFP